MALDGLLRNKLVKVSTPLDMYKCSARQTGRRDNQFTFVRGIVRCGFLDTCSVKFIGEALVLTLGDHKECIQSFPPFFINMHQLLLIKISLYMFDIQNE